MPNTETTPKLRGASVESIDTIITQMVTTSFDENEQNKKDLRALITRRFEGRKNSRVRENFRQWLKAGKFTRDLPWLEPVRQDNVDDEVLVQAAMDCLQVMVLDYLPGTRYFQGSYIHSRLWDTHSLKLIKSAFRVPHLSGAVGWMTARAFNSDAPYVVIPDAQLDLRGRVAVPDLHLGNRSVLGFPVSLIANNKELASISGFVFFSHPVPGIFPQPPCDEPGEEQRLSEVFENIRRVYESAVASAIESHIFRRYGKSVLASQLNTRDTQRVPLLPLSDDDPTGFLVTILFEGDKDGNLKAECEISESVLLETTAWLLRIASIYPEKWAPRFVQHMRQFGDLMEKSDLLRKTPMIWFSRGDSGSARRLYPLGYDVSAEIENLIGRSDQVASDVPAAPQSQGTRANLRRSMADAMALFGANAGAAKQADLVVPIYNQQDDQVDVMGFFRINCDASAIRDDSQVSAAFHNLWRLLKTIQELMNPNAALLFLAVEKEFVDSLHVQAGAAENHAARVQRIKLCTDTLNILSDWMARRMHQLLSPFLPEESAFTNESLEAMTQHESLIRYALTTFLSNETLIAQFDAWSDRCNDFSKTLTPTRNAPLPEVTFISFWPRLKQPVISDIVHEECGGAQVADGDEFSSLLLSDPGLLRMLALIAPLLKPGETIDIGPFRDLKNNGEGWEGMHFGVPTDSAVTSLEIKRQEVDGLMLDVKWVEKTQEGEQSHCAHLRWNCQAAQTQPRNLGGHAISSIPRIVAHRVGENVMSDLPLTSRVVSDDELRKIAAVFGSSTSVLDLVDSPKPEDLRSQLGHLERAMLYDEANATGWRFLPLHTSPSRMAFMAALYNDRIKRPSVLAFRDFALANAKAFYSARLYDAERQAAEEHAFSLAAIRHGYKGAVRQVKFAIEDATTSFYKNTEKTFISSQMSKVEKMAESVIQLAADAIHYASRKFKEPLWQSQTWQDMCDHIRVVIQALDRPRLRKVSFDDGIFDGRITFETAPTIWRHLLSKLIDNGITHGWVDPVHGPNFQVLIKARKSEKNPRHIILSVSNLLSPDSISKGNAARVRQILVEGRIVRLDDSADGTHGYGLIEAYNCCRLLGIDVDVNVDEGNMLVISLRMTPK